MKEFSSINIKTQEWGKMEKKKIVMAEVDVIHQGTERLYKLLVKAF